MFILKVKKFKMGVLWGILLFLFLILIHEFGHFIAAKKSGVKVLEFGIGIPPKLFTFAKDKSGTEYTFNLLPFGGFVRLKGEDPKQKEDFYAPDSFIQAKLWKKIIILIGGVLMNFFVAWFSFSFVFWHGVKPLIILPQNATNVKNTSLLFPTFDNLKKLGFISGDFKAEPAVIEEVLPESLAEKVGLKAGNAILKIGNTAINRRNITYELSKQIGRSFDLVYKSGDKIYTKKINCPQDNCLLGVGLKMDSNLEVKEIKFPFFVAIKKGLLEIGAQTRLTLNGLGKLGKGLLSFDRKKVKQSLDRVSGPVGAVKMGKEILDYLGRVAFLAFAGMISLALAILNILPIPALDGGRLVGVLIQAIFKMKPEKYFVIENYLNIFFFVLLMGMGIYVILKDLVVAWGVKIPGF